MQHINSTYLVSRISILILFVCIFFLLLRTIYKMRITRYSIDSLYLELARDQRICWRLREFEIEREKQVTVYTKGPRLKFKIQRSSRQRVFEVEKVNCIYILCEPKELQEKARACQALSMKKILEVSHGNNNKNKIQQQ